MKRHLISSPSCALLLTLLSACAQQGPLNLPATSAGNTPPSTTPPPLALNSAVAGGSIQVGAKTKQMASAEVDSKCSRVVAPFELADNLSDLAQLGGSLVLDQLGDKLSGSLDQMLRNSPSSAGNKAIQIPHAEMRLAAKRMNWLPMSVEQQYGHYLLAQRDKAGGLLTRGGKKSAPLYQVADKLLSEVLRGVQETHAYQFELFISTDAGQNAAALPGGLLLIDRALIENPALRDKAYFALAHEIAHVLQRHETRALQAKAFDAMALKSSQPEMVKTMQSAGKEPAAILSLLVQGKLLFERHSESQELQSDACAVRILDQSFKGDEGRLRAALQGFINGLPKPETSGGAKPKGQVVTANNALPNANAAGLLPLSSNTSGALQALDTVSGAIDLVTRPIDTHPSTEARVALLNEMLAEVRKRAVPKGEAVKPAGTANKASTSRPSQLDPSSSKR